MNVARSVINLFSGENKATLSGGIDIIAVENDNGEILTTPFHVRFGRLSGVLNPKEKVVSIVVNGQKTDAKMKLGPAGEAFFVEETRVNLSNDECTSPLISPLPSPELRGREVSAIMEMLSLDSDTEDDQTLSQENTKPAVTATLNEDINIKTSNTDEKYWENYALLSPEGSGSRALRLTDDSKINVRDVRSKPRRPSASPPEMSLEDGDTQDEATIQENEEDKLPKNSSWSWRWSWGDVNPHRRKTPSEKNSKKIDTPVLRALKAEDSDDDRYDTARELSGILAKPESTGDDNVDSVLKRPKNSTELENGGVLASLDARPEDIQSTDGTRNNTLSSKNKDSNSSSESFIKSVKISMCADLISKTAQDKYNVDNENLEIFFQPENIINQNDFKPDMLDNKNLLFLVNNSEFYRWDQLSPLVLSMEENSDIEEESSLIKGDKVESGGFFAWLRGSNNEQEPSTTIPVTMTRSPSSSMDDTFLSVSIDGDNAEGLPSARSVSPALSDELNLSQDAKKHYSEDIPKSYNGIYYRKTLRPPSSSLSSWGLKDDMNEIEFSVTTTSGEVVVVKSRIFLWPSNSKIVISDVDGTITKSDLLGHIMPRFGVNYSHTGVVSLYSTIVKHGYKIMYLSSRAIGQSNQTKNYLRNLEENDLKLPHGPVVLSPDRLFQSLAREVIYKRPQDFKVPALRDIKNLFPKDRPSPFYAGFGNRDSDKIAYKSVGVEPGKIFIVNPKGVIVTENLTISHSYSSIHELKDLVFPDITSPRKQKLSTHAAFNDNAFWKRPIMNIDTDDEEEDDENDISIDFVRGGDYTGSANTTRAKTDGDVLEDQIISNMMN